MSLFFLIVLQANAYTILLDPGHGGEDRGATRKITYKVNGKKRVKYYFEKDLVLPYARKIQEKLRKKKYTVHLTRSLDRTISLEKRAEIAEKVKADLFISIHMNSNFSSVSKGVETYYLDNHNDVAVKKVEEVENVGLAGGDLIVRQIITDLIVERTVKNSKNLALNIHYHLSKRVIKKFKMKDRKVRAGLFYVLALSKRPGVLLEVGFLSNSSDLKKILDPRFQDAYATAVVRGIDDYLKNKK
ncbi:MAG: N-acetylmuramoyl-L-alanine amidase [Bacteriovoracaceae bacterium]|nr:N-acetylmuramoyl-L-alanine amidase [Bacteriovoracaceae bacterium]